MMSSTNSKNKVEGLGWSLVELFPTMCKALATSNTNINKTINGGWFLSNDTWFFPILSCTGVHSYPVHTEI